MFIFLCRFAPGELTLRSAGLKKGTKAPGKKLPALTPVFRQRRVWKESRPLVKTTCCKRELPSRIPQTPSAFHLHAQRKASRRRNTRQQSRSCAPQGPRLRRSPKPQPALLRSSAMTSQLFIRFRAIALIVMSVGFELRIRVRERQVTLDLHAQ
jgi:hypothetical protein